MYTDEKIELKFYHRKYTVNELKKMFRFTHIVVIVVCKVLPGAYRSKLEPTLFFVLSIIYVTCVLRPIHFIFFLEKFIIFQIYYFIHRQTAVCFFVESAPGENVR